MDFEFLNQLDRFEILSHYLDQVSNNLEDEEKQTINDNMHGFTGADIYSSIKKAILEGLK